MASSKANESGNWVKIEKGAGGGMSQGSPFTGIQVPVNAPQPAVTPRPASSPQAPSSGGSSSKK